MSDSQSEIVDLVLGTASGLPAPVKTSFLKALNQLLGGLTAIPAAKLRQYAQGIEDTTVARSMAAAKIATELGAQSSTDPLLIQAAAEIYLPTGLRKARNRLLVAQRAAEHIQGDHNENAQADTPTDDWMNAFARFVEDASSEKLQDLFGRILGGQVRSPNSFMLSTLRTVSELDQSIAVDFELVWSKSVGEAIDYSQEFQRGDGFSRWKRLAEAGLLATTETAQFLPPFKPAFDGNAIWSPMSADKTFLAIFFGEGCSAQWRHISFTRVGREIGSILPRPDFEGNMRQAAKGISTQGVTRIELIAHDKQTEVLYLAPS